jgi:hypothetical protein
MGFLAWHQGRILKAYPGVIYEVSLLGGYGYCVLLRKDVRFGGLLMIVPRVYGTRPFCLEEIFRCVVEEDVSPPLMFFPVLEGVRRGMLRSVGVMRHVGSWEVPALPENDDERRKPWLWRKEEGWSFMPVDGGRDDYGVLSVGVLRLLRGLDLVEPQRKKRKNVGKRG